ncbi:peroxisomal membrane protein PEX16 [Mycena floridula]|nr:peroxisomal membrane protein PEX16 [Mycena floridula]
MSSSIARYETFLVNNVATISSIESSLRSLTWFLPGRFKDAELASEALSASLNVISMYHDTLLTKVVQSNPSYRPLIPTSLHSRFTRAWSDKNTLYKSAARALELLRFTELFLEMGLRRRVSRQNKWRAIILLEILKALLRFVLLRITRRPVLSPPIPERDLDPTSIPSPPSPESSHHSPLATPQHLQNNLVPLPPHPLLTSPPPARSDTSVEDYLLPKALTTASMKPSLTLVRTLSSPQDWIAESLYILRPLIYVSLLVSDRRSNRPLVAALVMELLSRALRRTSPPSASIERTEYARRDRDILWYLFRGTVWTGFTRPKIESMANRAAHTPVLSLFSALVKDWVPLIDEYYYYTAP